MTVAKELVLFFSVDFMPNVTSQNDSFTVFFFFFLLFSVPTSFSPFSFLPRTVSPLSLYFSPLTPLQDLYVYISQDEVFSDFNNTEALFWFHRDLIYGDWNMGEDGDGCYEHYRDLDIPEVRRRRLQYGGGVEVVEDKKGAIVGGIE